MPAGSRGDSASWTVGQNCDHNVVEGHPAERPRGQETLGDPSVYRKHTPKSFSNTWEYSLLSAA